MHASGRPVLVGTLTVEESERLAARLGAAGVACEVLNAKNDAAEARIVARAGALGAVTISTNMAGRGTDIRLGGDDEAGTRSRSSALGGLYVIGTNRHESRRVDLQLRGRAGRQGDPGESRFFVSLEDDLLVRYGIRGSDRRPLRRPTARDEPIDHPVVRARDRPRAAHRRRPELRDPADALALCVRRRGSAAARDGAPAGDPRMAREVPDVWRSVAGASRALVARPGRRRCCGPSGPSRSTTSTGRGATTWRSAPTCARAFISSRSAARIR